MAILNAFQIGPSRLLAVDHPQIVAAMKAIGYVWPTVPDTPAKIQAVLNSLEALFADLAPLAIDDDVESVAFDDVGL